jgi:hypothetical protein
MMSFYLIYNIMVALHFCLCLYALSTTFLLFIYENSHLLFMIGSRTFWSWCSLKELSNCHVMWHSVGMDTPARLRMRTLFLVLFTVRSLPVHLLLIHRLCKTTVIGVWFIPIDGSCRYWLYSVGRPI